MTSQDNAVINYMLSEMVGPSTLSGYNKHGLSEWVQFLRGDRGFTESSLRQDTVIGLQRPDDSDESRIKLFILYVYYLRQRGVKDVSVQFKALGHDFILKGWFSLAELLKSPLVMVARKHGERGQARERAVAKNHREKEAVSGEMITNMYDTEWSLALHSSDMNIVDRAVACLLGWLMVQFGLRISNLAKTESDNSQRMARHPVPEGTIRSKTTELESLMFDRHAIRAEDVWLLTEGEEEYSNAFEFVRKAERGVVTEIVLNIVTSKVNQTASRIVKHVLRRESLGEKKLLEMVVTFISFAQYDHKSDMLFSRPHASRIRGTLSDPLLSIASDMGRFRYQQDVVNELVKNCAVRFGLDPNSFSTKSFKNCGITSAQMVRNEVGMSEKEVAQQFDHASVTSNRHYQRPNRVAHGPLALITEESNRLYNHENLIIQSKLSKLNGKWLRKN